MRGGKAWCWHRWALDVVLGVWRYRECSKCHRRRADRFFFGAHGPVDSRWLNGETDVLGERPRFPPIKPSDIGGLPPAPPPTPGIGRPETYG